MRLQNFIHSMNISDTPVHKVHIIHPHWNKTLNEQYKYKVDTYVGENYKNNKNTVQNN